MTPLISSPDYGFYFCMAGRIRTKQQCPKCGGSLKGSLCAAIPVSPFPPDIFLTFPGKGTGLKSIPAKTGTPWPIGREPSASWKLFATKLTRKNLTPRNTKPES